MEKECGRVLNLAKLQTHNLEVTFLRSPSLLSLLGRGSCNLGISSGNFWEEEVSWNKILFEILDYQNHGDSCVSFLQSKDKIDWETSNKKIKGVKSIYCGNSKPPLNQPFTTEKYHTLVIKFDPASYKDDASITFKLVANVLHSDDAMEKECGRVLNLAKLQTHNLEVTFLRSPSLLSLLGRGSCNLGISSGNFWEEEVSWNKILFEILDYQNHGDSCVSFLQSKDKIDWETSNKKIKGVKSIYCGNSKPPLNQPFTSEKYHTLVIKFDPASYKDDASITFKLVANVLHSDGHCSQYECDNGNCIPKDLKCGKHNPCGDKSHCRPDGISVKTIIFIVIGIAAGILFIFLAVKYLRCKNLCKSDGSDSDNDEDRRVTAQDRDTAEPTAPPLLSHPGVDGHDTNSANEQREMVDDSMLPPPSYEEVMRQGT